MRFFSSLPSSPSFVMMKNEIEPKIWRLVIFGGLFARRHPLFSSRSPPTKIQGPREKLKEEKLESLKR
jgi:hypothetical protein